MFEDLPVAKMGCVGIAFTVFAAQVQGVYGMARRPRVDLVGIPQHIVQRGNDRHACFYACDDYVRYLEALRAAALHYGVQVHAYCLMTNHVHLLITPMECGAMSAMMQSIGRRYVRYINTRYRRTGTLWEGRFKASLVEHGGYLMTCYRYIECNPVRAGMVVSPADYRWSSHRCNVLDEYDPVVTPHDEYRSLGVDGAERRAAYRSLFLSEIASGALEDIRASTRQELAYGSERFKDQVEAMTQRRLRPGRPGRPAGVAHKQQLFSDPK
jgi:putative transposase